MKVHKSFGEPFANGKRLAWFDRWTYSLAQHYAELYNMKIVNKREGSRGRLKWDICLIMNLFPLFVITILMGMPMGFLPLQ